MENKRVADLRWWLASEGHRHEAIGAVLRRMRAAETDRVTAAVSHARLYGNAPRLGLGPRSYTRSMPMTKGGTLGLNVVKNMCQSVTAEVTQNRPKPTFLPSTTRADNAYSIRQRAQDLEKAVEGIFYEVKLYEMAPRIFLDACIFGTGVLHVFDEHGKIKIERVIPTEIHILEEEAVDAQPRQLHRTKYIDRLVLAEMFPDHREEIMTAPSGGDDVAADPEMHDDVVEVRESWHLRSGPEAKDGMHCITVEGCDLLCEEEWEGDSFPFAFVRWSYDPVGFWGIGLAAELRGIQLEINKLLSEIQQAHHLLGKTRVYVERGSKLVKAHLRNEWADIVEFTGTPPITVPPSIVAPELYQHLWNLYAKAYEIAGISQMAATSQKEEGVDSAIAMRTMADMQSKRFIVVGREFEALFLQAAELVIDRAKALDERSREDDEDAKGFRVNAHRGTFLEEIDWSDVDMKRDEYFMKIFPASMLPTTPAGRLSFVNDLMGLGVSPEEALELIDIPDTDKFMKRKNAPRRVIERNIESILRNGVFMGPEPGDNHELGLKIATEALAEARLDGVPEAKLELLRRYQVVSNDFLNPEPPPVPLGAAPPMGPPPMGPPMPPGPPMNDNGGMPPMPMAS